MLFEEIRIEGLDDLAPFVQDVERLESILSFASAMFENDYVFFDVRLLAHGAYTDRLDFWKESPTNAFQTSLHMLVFKELKPLHWDKELMQNGSCVLVSIKESVLLIEFNPHFMQSLKASTN